MQSVARKTQIPNKTWQRNPDNPRLWIAVFSGSIILHLLAFLLLRSLNIYNGSAGNPFASSESENAIPIEILDTPTTKSVSPNHLSTSQTSPIPPVPKTVTPPSTTENYQVSPSRVSDGAIVLTKKPNLTQPHRKTISPLQTPTPPIQKHFKQPQTPLKKANVEKLSQNHHQKTNLPPTKLAQANTRPTFTKYPSNSPQKHSTATNSAKPFVPQTPTPEQNTPFKNPPPINTNQQQSPTNTNQGQKISQLPTNANGNAPRINNPAPVQTPVSTPQSGSGGFTLSWNPISKNQYPKLNSKGIQTTDIPDTLPQPIGKNTTPIPPIPGIKPKTLLLSLQINNKGDCEGQPVVVGEEQIPGNVDSLKNLPPQETNMYQGVLGAFCSQVNFTPAKNKNGKLPLLSNLYMEMKIQSYKP